MSYQSTVLARNPVLYLPFTETSGTTFADLSGNGHTGTIHAHVTPGGADGFLVGEKAATLTQDTGEIRVAAFSSPEITSFSAENWFQLVEPAGLDNWFQFYFAGAGGSVILDFNQPATDPGINHIELFPNISAFPVVYFGDVTFSVPKLACWHHYVVTYAGNTLKIYVDGVLVDTITNSDLTGLDITPTMGVSWANHGSSTPHPILPININHSALYDFALTDAQVAENYAAAVPRQDAACFADWVRLRHRNSDVCWEHSSRIWRVRSGGDLAEEHDGTTRTVYSDAVPVLQTPFPVSAEPTASYLGLHPTTGLPVVAPLPKLAPLPPAVLTPTGTTCLQVRCGASDALANKLADIYHTVEQWVQPALTGLLAAFFDALAGAGFSLLDLLTDGLGLVLTPDELAMVSTINAAIGTLSAGVLGDALPFLNSDQQEWLKKAAFDSLICTNDSVQLDRAQMDGWYQRILNASGNPPNFGFIQQEALYAIVGWGRDLALSEWAVAANTGAHSPSSVCDSWS